MSTTFASYRNQLRRAAIALAVGRNADVESDLADGMTVAHVKMFTDGNLDKRFSKLQASCELLADGFDGLDEQIEEYVRTVPLAAYDIAATDAERFLDWISAREPLTAEQSDLIVCQRSRHAVEFVALKQRLAHIRFQELLSVSAKLLKSATTRSRAAVHLNPIHVWATFQTQALLSDEDDVPATVLFFPVGKDIRTAVVTPEVEDLLQSLEQQGPRRLRAVLGSLDGWSREETLELLGDLCELGIVAVG